MGGRGYKSHQGSVKSSEVEAESGRGGEAGGGCMARGERGPLINTRGHSAPSI